MCIKTQVIPKVYVANLWQISSQSYTISWFLKDKHFSSLKKKSIIKKKKKKKFNDI